jgi:hypothetical protein
MHPAEIELIEVAKRLVTVSVQIARAYNTEQSKLKLDLVLSQSRLSSKAGTDQSLAALEHLGALTAAHKIVFEKFVLASSSAMSKPLFELPEDRQQEHRASFVATTNWLLSAQSAFYENRERWIKAAKDICILVEACRATSQFGAEGITFATDQDFEVFQSLLNVIEETHQQEVAYLSERLAKLAKSASVLGLKPLE